MLLSPPTQLIINLLRWETLGSLESYLLSDSKMAQMQRIFSNPLLMVLVLLSKYFNQNVIQVYQNHLRWTHTNSVFVDGHVDSEIDRPAICCRYVELRCGPRIKTIDQEPGSKCPAAALWSRNHANSDPCRWLCK